MVQHACFGLDLVAQVPLLAAELFDRAHHLQVFVEELVHVFAQLPVDVAALLPRAPDLQPEDQRGEEAQDQERAQLQVDRAHEGETREQLAGQLDQLGDVPGELVVDAVPAQLGTDFRGRGGVVELLVEREEVRHGFGSHAQVVALAGVVVHVDVQLLEEGSQQAAAQQRQRCHRQCTAGAQCLLRQLDQIGRRVAVIQLDL